MRKIYHLYLLFFAAVLLQSLKRTNTEFRWKTSQKSGTQGSSRHVEILYDPVATVVTESQDVDFNVFTPSEKELIPDINMDSSGFKQEIARMKIKTDKNKISARSAKFARALYEDIKTENDQLKYEYIEMVKNGKEKEHLMFLLTGPHVNVLII